MSPSWCITSMAFTLLALPTPLSVNIIWTGLLTAPPSIQTNRKGLTILCIKLDLLNLQERLPQDKFDGITALLEEWSQKRWCKGKELESLKVVIHSSTFLDQQMLQLLFNKCWTVCHAVLNVEIGRSTCWTLLNETEMTSIPFYKLPLVERC